MIMAVEFETEGIIFIRDGFDNLLEFFGNLFNHGLASVLVVIFIMMTIIGIFAVIVTLMNKI